MLRIRQDGSAYMLNALALHLAVHRNTAIYDGSMPEWTKGESLPLKLGDKL